MNFIIKTSAAILHVLLMASPYMVTALIFLSALLIIRSFVSGSRKANKKAPVVPRGCGYGCGHCYLDGCPLSEIKKTEKR